MKWKVFLVSLFLTCSSPKICSAQNSESKKKEEDNLTKLIGNIPLCYRLNQNAPVKIITPKDRYHGRVIIQSSIDTTTLSLVNHKIVFAKLSSKSNPKDTVEIRIENKVGNYQYVEELLPQLILKIQHLTVEKSTSKICKPVFGYTIPILVE